MEKGRENVRRSFYEGLIKQSDAKHARLTAERAGEMWRRILRSFAGRSDGGELADGFVAVIRHFSELGFWRGYNNAKRHYATMNAIKRTPDGRQEVHRSIEEMLEEDVNMAAEKICERLDELGLSAYFDLNIRGKQKTILVGPKSRFYWKSVRKEASLKNMISRLRTRVRRERNAKAWVKLSDRVFRSGDSDHLVADESKRI